MYVGVDVFGRGCPGGGGWNTREAMQMIADAGLSAALFAPGWVFEELPEKDKFHENQLRFWGMQAVFAEAGFAGPCFGCF